MQRLRAVAGLDFEIIELKQQFCGNTHTHTNQLSTVTLCPRRRGLINEFSKALDLLLDRNMPHSSNRGIENLQHVLHNYNLRLNGTRALALYAHPKNHQTADEHCSQKHCVGN